MQEALDIYREALKRRRSVVEDAYGRQGGLKRPTVDLAEFADIAKTINDTLANDSDQMGEHSDSTLQLLWHRLIRCTPPVPYGSDPSDIYTPRMDDLHASKM